MLVVSAIVHAQDVRIDNDTIHIHMLAPVVVNAAIVRDSSSFLPDIVETNVYAGKKTNRIRPDGATANLAQNNVRQAFAKIPGITSWDMDGAGTQLNIGTRGTDSHRSIEMNMRQNGYNTNSDIFGYPENHYTSPLQGVREVQYVRGSAALQFGSQFGGMMNFVTKQGDSTRPIAVESEQTAGSNGFFNSFNAIGGTSGNANYYAYYDNRSGNGWRPNSAFRYHAYYAALNYKAGEKATFGVQFSRMDYVQQIAGGLTDAQFRDDPRQSLRKRNFFNPEINIPAIKFKYLFNSNTVAEVTANMLFGQRNSVQFINNPDVKDTINAATGAYNARQVDRDYYNAFALEARILHSYNKGRLRGALSAGVRYSDETTRRSQKGVGTTGSDFDLSLAAPYGVDLHFTTRNYALFAENVFYISKKFSVTPGIRYENINSRLDGVITNATVPVHYTGSRSFPLFGTGLQYQASRTTQLYGNFSQAYRPYLYASVTPADRLDVIDPNLKDSHGYDIDIGYRGQLANLLRFDVNLFRVFYGNRAGLLSQTDATGTHLLTTNIGDAIAKGVETFAELSLLRLAGNDNLKTDVNVFHSFSYTNARYTTGSLNKSGTNVDVTGNEVENTPAVMEKAGIQVLAGSFTASLQYSYTSACFNDALNTLNSANGVTGKMPAYHLWDCTAAWSFQKLFRLSAGINNLANAKYFNRRITMYPGPGILPADGRTFYISFAVKM